jgi:hypothetical protein
MVRAPGRLRCGPSIYPTEQDVGQGCVGKLKVGLGAISLNKSILSDYDSVDQLPGIAEERLAASRWQDRRPCGDQLGEFAQVLGGGGEVELIARAVRSP